MEQKLMLPPLVYRDFVNREEQRKFMHEVVLNADRQILLVEGYEGIGKTKLLKEFHAECSHLDLAAVYIDLSERRHDPDYWRILFAFPHQYPQAFATFDQTFAQIRNEANTIRQMTPLPKVDRSEVEPTGQENKHSWWQRTIKKLRSRQGKPTVSIDKKAPQIGLNVQGSLNAPYANIAGRDLYYLVQNGSWEDKVWVRQALTLGFQQCLQALAVEKKVILLLDHWEKGEEDTKQWVQDCLLPWCLTRPFPNVLYVIAHDLDGGKPDWFEQRSEYGVIQVEALPEEAVRFYWTEICHLPISRLGPLEQYSNPQILVLAAKDVARKLDRSRVTEAEL